MTHASVAVAGPVSQGAATITNLGWEPTEAALARVRGGESFEAVAKAVSEDPNRATGGVIGLRPASRLPDERIKQLGPVVAHTGEELTRKLGGRWPHPY